MAFCPTLNRRQTALLPFVAGGVAPGRQRMTGPAGLRQPAALS
ncbi:hypothetical protein [Hydrogenophaga sp.]|nr:hypothetical protein [Hydrogenophaga sp.]